jgi:hypothetical protein
LHSTAERSRADVGFFSGQCSPFRKFMVEQKTSNENFLGLVLANDATCRAAEFSCAALLPGTDALR